MSKQQEQEARPSEQLSIRGRDLTRIEVMAKEGRRSRQDQIGLIIDEFCEAHSLDVVTAESAPEAPGGADEGKDQP